MTSPEAMKVELLPCPFCGAQANSHQIRARSVQFVCPNCEASGPIADGNPEQEQVWNDARSAWNRRATPAVDGLEVVAWLATETGCDPLPFTSEGRAKNLLDSGLGGTIEPLVRLSDAQALSTQVQRLTEESEALRKASNENAKLRGQRDAALARIKQMQDSNSRMAEEWSSLKDQISILKTALKRIADMTGTAGTEAGPLCKWTENGVTTMRPTGIGNFANDIARRALSTESQSK